MATSSRESKETKFVDLPYDCLFQIFGYMSYHEVAQYRLICRHVNAVCHSVLSSGAEHLRMKLNRIQSRLKSQLPRRESARRGHVASDLLEIVNSVENRVSIIRLALDRYLVTGQLTFFPGKVLDEALRILAQIETLASSRDGAPLLTPFSAIQKVTMLRDLRDLSTMASEHIDDVILPCLRNRQSSTDPLVKRCIPCRSHEFCANSPEKSSNSQGLLSPVCSSNSASSSSNEGNQSDPMIRLCGLFFEQFRNMSEHFNELKTQQKQANAKMAHLTTEINSMKQQLAREQLHSASLAKKLELTETALADIRRLTINTNHVEPVDHICEPILTSPSKSKKRKSQGDEDTAESSKISRIVNEVDEASQRRVTRATAKTSAEQLIVE